MYPILESLSGLPEEYLNLLSTDEYEKLVLRSFVVQEILGLDIYVSDWSDKKQLIMYTNHNQIPIYFEYWKEAVPEVQYPWWCKPPVWRPHDDIEQAIMCVRELCNVGYRKQIRQALQAAGVPTDLVSMLLISPTRLMNAVEQVLFNVVS